MGRSIGLKVIMEMVFIFKNHIYFYILKLPAYAFYVPSSSHKIISSLRTRDTFVFFIVAFSSAMQCLNT